MPLPLPPHTLNTQTTLNLPPPPPSTQTDNRSDVVCEYPLKDMLAYHLKSGGEATILVTRVDDPSKYGVVVTDDAGKVERFVEKPKVRVCGVCVVGGRVLQGL